MHGWTSSGDALRAAGATLTAQTDRRITPYYFDYEKDSATWAGADVVSGCLSTYINAVSGTYRSAGGDGKVLVVAHSMGGLATLYASAKSGTAANLGGLITFDTPYLGSPFGDGSIAGFLQGLRQHGKVNVPPGGSDAQLCLAPHKSGAALPVNCRYGLPPYLPTGVPVTQIAGQVTVKRMLGPFHLYDFNLGSDGIVPTSSSHGYLEMGKKSQWPRGQQLSLRTDKCTITSDTLQIAAKAAGWTKSLLSALVVGAGQVYADNDALDGLLSGEMTWGLFVYLGAATLAAPCSHTNVYSDQSALNQATEALKNYLDALTPATQIMTLAPVDQAGNPVAGWQVNTRQDTHGGIECAPFGNAYPSPAAVTGNIYSCSPTAAAADTCWPAAIASQMLCLWDPWSHTLTKLTSNQMVPPVNAYEQPLPIGLELANGDRCRLRNGGSWSYPQAHPSWVGFFACDAGGAVWGPRSLRDGIERSGRQWTVHTGMQTGNLTKVAVLKAYYVTTAD